MIIGLTYLDEIRKKTIYFERDVLGGTLIEK